VNDPEHFSAHGQATLPSRFIWASKIADWRVSFHFGRDKKLPEDIEKGNLDKNVILIHLNTHPIEDLEENYCHLPPDQYLYH
jgi:hypothetical protein